MSVKLISVTPDAEKMMAYVAASQTQIIKKILTMQNCWDIALSTTTGLCLSRHL